MKDRMKDRPIILLTMVTAYIVLYLAAMYTFAFIDRHTIIWIAALAEKCELVLNELGFLSFCLSPRNHSIFWRY